MFHPSASALLAPVKSIVCVSANVEGDSRIAELEIVSATAAETTS